MQGVSRTSLATLRAGLAETSREVDALLALSDELFAVTGLLAGNLSLRRSLSDPSTSAAGKARVVDSLLSGKIGADALDVTRSAVQSPWSQPRDLVDALETASAEAALLAAEQQGQLDAVEDELFRFERILAAEPQLRSALTDIALPTERKQALLDKLLDGKITDVTLGLITRAITAPRGRTIERALSDASALAASRRDRLIARVTTAITLSAAEQRDLAASLATAFGRELHLQLVVDPAILGGMSVKVGDEVIDATVIRQLDEARLHLTGGAGARRTTA